MPTRRKGESKSSYMKRCVPMLIKEGKSQDQAVAICMNMSKKKSPAKNMEYVTINLDGRAVREEMLDGEKHWVAPMALMTEAVHEGSQGPLFYPRSELTKWAPAWNHKPIVLNHPDKGSACTPEYLNKFKFGVVLNTRYEGKQRAEGWFNQRRTREVEPRVAMALESKKMMEISTGLYLDKTGEPGEFDGKKYIAIAANHKPDHVAVLPDCVGACSIKDGGGLLQLNRDFSTKQRKKLAKSGAAMPDGSFPIKNAEDLKNAIHLVGKAKNPEAAKRHIISRARALGLTSLLPDSWKVAKNSKPDEELVVNDMSHDEIRCDLTEMIQGLYSKQMEDMPALGYPYVRAVYEDYCIYMFGGKMYQVGYQMSNDEVSLVGDPTEVEQKVNYVPVENSSGDTTTEELTMGKKELVDAVITNELTLFKEEDRKFLDGCTEDQLKKFIPTAKFAFNSEEELDKHVKNKAEEKARAEEKAKADKEAKDKADTEAAKNQQFKLTPEQWLAAMPPEARLIHNNAMKALQGEMTQLVGTIVANKNNKFKQEDLMKMDLDVLRNMAALCTSEQAAAQAQEWNYLGLGPIPQVTNNQTQQQALPLPVYNAEKFAAAK